MRNFTLFRLSTALLFAAFLAGCSSSSDDPVPQTPPTTPPVTDTTPPTISSTTPADDATAVERDVAFAVVFDEAMDAATITASNLTLTDDLTGEAVDGAVTYDAGSFTATFTPDAPIALAGQYTGTVTTAVTDAAGNALAAAASATFRSVDGAFGTAENLSSLYGDETQVAVADNGDAIVVYSSEDNNSPFSDNILVSRYVADSNAWTAPFAIDAGDGDAVDPTIAGDGEGNAIVLWAQEDVATANSDIFASSYDSATDVWSTPVKVDAVGSDAREPDVGVAEDGSAIAAWHDNNTSRPLFSVYDPASTSWSAAAQVAASAVNVFSVELAVNSSGTAVVVWEQGNGTGIDDIVASIFDGTSWSAPMTLDNRVSSARSRNVGIDDAGNAIAVWEQEDDSGTFISDVLASVYDAGAGTWGSPELIDDSTEDTDDANVGMDALGNAFAIWVERDATGNDQVAVRRFTSGVWETPVILSDTLGFAADMSVVFDARGNAIAFWTQGTPEWGVYISRYTAIDDSWSASVVIDPTPDEISDPIVGVGANGDGVAAWTLVDLGAVNGSVFD